MTIDYSAFETSLAAIDTAIIPRGGTDLAAAISQAESSLLDNTNHKILILLTDGEVPWPDADQWPMDLLVVSTGPCPPGSLGYESIQLGLGADA